MKRFQMCIWFGNTFDLLREVGSCEQARVGLAQACVGLPQACFFKMMKCGSPGEVPGDFALMKEVEMSFERATWFCSSAGKGPENPVVSGQPNGQKAGFTLAADMEENSFILKCLAQGVEPTRGGKGWRK